MSWKPWTYWLHKWSAVIVVLITLIWFVSGIVMVLPPRWFGAPSSDHIDSSGGPPRYQDIQVTVPQALAILEGKLREPLDIRGVHFVTVQGRLLYQIQTKDASHLVDTESGEYFVIDSQIARSLLAEVLSPEVEVEVTLLEGPDPDHVFGPFPSYRFRVSDEAETNYYVAAPTGEIRVTNRGSRLFRFLRGTHTLDFLRPAMGNFSVRIILFVFSVGGTLMTLFGVVILWIQFVNWRARRLARA